VVLTGDSHLNAVRDVPPDFRNLGGPPVATEFVGTSISSNGDPGAAASTLYAYDPANPHHRFRNNERGYVRCTLTRDAWISDFRKVTTVRQPEASTSTRASFGIEHGRAGAVLASV
jgi:alkaline phosphatase D